MGAMHSLMLGMRDGVQLVSCSWHIQRSWAKRIKEEGLLKALKSLRLQSSEEKFMELYNRIKENWVCNLYLFKPIDTKDLRTLS